jgi:hypothetical protein
MLFSLGSGTVLRTCIESNKEEEEEGAGLRPMRRVVISPSGLWRLQHPTSVVQSLYVLYHL